MDNIADCKPSDQEVIDIWSDTYNFFLMYKDVDCAEHENEISLAARTIEMNYSNCDLVMTMTSAIIRLLIDRSDIYQGILVFTNSDYKGGCNG